MCPIAQTPAAKSRTVRGDAIPMTSNTDIVARVIEDLNELIEALDRRLPHLGGPIEADIARDAAALRQKAVRRIEELEESARRRAGSGP